MGNEYLDIALQKVIEQEVNKVLTDIKTEIEQNIGDNLYKNDGLYHALQIIDKYTPMKRKRNRWLI